MQGGHIFFGIQKQDIGQEMMPKSDKTIEKVGHYILSSFLENQDSFVTHNFEKSGAKMAPAWSTHRKKGTKTVPLGCYCYKQHPFFQRGAFFPYL